MKTIYKNENNCISEYTFLNPIKDEIKNIIHNAISGHDKKYGERYCKRISIAYNSQFFDKIKKKTKINTTRNIKKTKIASQNRSKLVKINKMIILIEGIISKNMIITCMKCGKIPILWRKFFLNIANNRDYIFIFCNRSSSRFDCPCGEWFIHNNSYELDEVPENFIY